MTTLFGIFLIFNAVVGLILIVMGVLKDVINSRQNLKRFLFKLGWEPYEYDLWRNRKTGVIAGFQDAIAMELQTSVQEKKIFKGHSFKEP